jgi:hypothetical protein
VALIPSNSAIAFAHFISALIMLGGFGYISFFLFTKLDLGQTREDDGKIIRNRWYRGFGAAIWVFLALLAIVFGLRELADWWPSWLSNIKPVFVLETLAVWAFGASWFLKGVAHARWLSRLRELSPIKSLRPAS